MNNKKDFIWSTIGSLLFGFTSLFYMVIITRINGLNDAGLFTYSFAVACILFAIGTYCTKTFQITELNKSISDTDYLYNRLITCFFMIIVCLLFCLITKADLYKFSLILLLTIFRGTDAFIDSIHAIIQRNKELYKVGMSLFFKTLLLVGLFIIVDLIFKNILISCLSVVILNIIFCIFVDYKIASKYIKKTKFSFDRNLLLLKTGLPLFIYTFLTVFLTNIPKYIMNIYADETLQAILGIIIMPASFLALASQYIVQPFLNTITSNISKKKYLELKKMIFKIILFLVFIGLFVLLICYIIGIPILELIYGIDLSGQKINLSLIIIGSIFYSVVIFLSSIYVSLRKTYHQLIILVITSIVSLIFCYILISKYLIFGAALAYLLSMFIQMILFIIVLIFLYGRLLNDNN